MQIIFGTLSLRGLTSLLAPENDWLLMVGFPDPQQAGVAATNFIVNVKHLQDSTPVAVTGARSSIGEQPVIVMSDINAAGSLMEHALGGATSTSAAVKSRSAAASGKRQRAGAGKSKAAAAQGKP